MFDFAIVGAGFAGAVIAERLSAAGARVIVMDRRPHVAGNAFDYFDGSGVLVHRYGPHIFHANSAEIVAYLSQFTEWRLYQHRVLSCVDGQLFPIPINLTTVNQFFGVNLSREQMADFLATIREPKSKMETSEDVVVGKVGRELFEKFYRGYTLKQWGREAATLDASVAGRVPIRLNADDRYFTDKYQLMPAAGYARMFESMLRAPGIRVLLQADFEDVRHEIEYKHLVYTGPIDAYFGHALGRLPYRSIRFRMETKDGDGLQLPVGTINYPNDYDFTRVTEFRHLTGQRHDKSVLVYEHPCDDGDPYYPVPTQESRALYKEYEKLAQQERDVTFCGRLGTYRYYNMDQVVAQALVTARNLLSGSRDSA